MFAERKEKEDMKEVIERVLRTSRKYFGLDDAPSGVETRSNQKIKGA